MGDKCDHDKVIPVVPPPPVQSVGMVSEPEAWIDTDTVPQATRVLVCGVRVASMPLLYMGAAQLIVCGRGESLTLIRRRSVSLVVGLTGGLRRVLDTL